MAPSPSSPSKRQKISLQEEADVVVDRLSDLPDCLLCHILSFLSTTEAVATSILSCRWKTLWTFVPYVYLDGRNLEMRLPSPYPITFSHIVSRLFSQHKAPHLRKFHFVAGLSCDPLSTWVGAAISPNLEELDLSIYLESNPVGNTRKMFKLPPSIFNCKKLVVLKLSGKILLDLRSSFTLPSLKILHLCLNNSERSQRRLLSGCPVLEDLVVERMTIGGEVDLEICLPTLKRLKFDFRNLTLEDRFYAFWVNAPALEYFNFIGDLCERDVHFHEKLPNSVDANLHIVQSRHVIQTPFLVFLDNPSLHFCHFLLETDTTECLSFLASYDEFSIFHNLAWLNFQVNCCNAIDLTDLLELSPNLQVLVLEKLPSSLSYAHQLDCPKEKLYVTDVSPHLTTFYFRGFKGFKDELKFVRCILKKARILKKITFAYGGNYQIAAEEKIRILKKVSNFPRRSMSCQFAFE